MSKELFQIVLDEIKGVVDNVSEEQLQAICNEIVAANNIYVYGEGRSGFSSQGFAMRLMHLGFQVYFVGETTTPAMGKEDVLIAVSGSGTSPLVLATSEKSKEIGCKVVGITSKESSPLGKIADTLLIIPGTVRGEQGDDRKSIQLLSSLFDQSLHITLDIVCLMLSKQSNRDNAEATKRHF